jgi:hypothetical protein
MAVVKAFSSLSVGQQFSPMGVRPDLPRGHTLRDFRPEFCMHFRWLPLVCMLLSSHQPPFHHTGIQAMRLFIMRLSPASYVGRNIRLSPARRSQTQSTVLFFGWKTSLHLDKQNKLLGPYPASELYRLIDRHLWTNLVLNFVDRRVSRSQRGGSLTVVNLSFLDRSRYFSFK